MNILTISVTEPAPVYIPPEIKTVGIIDRSLTSEKNKVIDNLDKILSAEGKNLDKDAARAAVTGLSDELMKSRKFGVVKIIDKSEVKTAGLGVFPAALDWTTIDKICRENSVDALFELSFFDTDAKVDYDMKHVEIMGPLGIKIPAVEHHATMTTFIKTGWRIYDMAGKVIMDEYPLGDKIVSKGIGINPMKAAEAIIGRKEAVLQVSNNIGSSYASRILPYQTRVTRDYYVRGTDNFVIAKRRAQTGDWKGASELWNKEVSNPKAKVAGRACYNMAIINEINGDLNAAVEWASKAYTDYNNKNALRYINILKARIESSNLLKQQTK